MNKDSQLIFEAYRQTRPGQKTFKELFPVGTQVIYKQDSAHDDGDPDKSYKQGKGIVVSTDLSYGEPEEDKFWGIIELENGITPEVRVDELKKIGFKSDYIPNPATMNRISQAQGMLRSGVEKLLKQHEKNKNE